MRSMRKAALRTLLMSCCFAMPGVAMAQEDTSDDDIIIFGQRASDRESLERQRDADNNVEVVSSAEAGQLPDGNVAESVRRLQGVSTVTDKGEGRYVVIRGIEPSLANVTLNGQTAPAPEPESRQVKLDDIPPSLIGSVTVIKTLTPDLDANAIAGQVDIATLTAFDRNGTFGSLRGSSGEYELNGESPFEADATFGTRFGANDEFGVVLAANYSTRPLYSDDLIASGDTPWQSVNGILTPTRYDSRAYVPIERNREGAVLNFDWRPNDDLEAYLHLSYSSYEDDETRQRLRIDFPTANSSYNGGAGLTGPSGTIRNRAQRLVRRRIERNNTFTLATGAEFDWTESWLSFALTYAQSEKEDPLRDEFRFRTPTITGIASFDLNNRVDDLFLFTPGAAALTASNFTLDNYRDVEAHATEDLWQGRVDYRWDIGIGDGSNFQVGVKYLTRERENDRDGQAYTCSSCANLTSLSNGTVNTQWDGRYAFGPTINFDATRAFFLANPGLFTLDPVNTRADSLGDDYRVSETILAGYAMARLQFGPVLIIPGVRVENTEAEYAAKAITPTSLPTAPYSLFGEQSYTDWFPGVNIRYDATDDLVLRAALTTAIGRPDYDQIAPRVTIDGTDVSLGNADLQPLEAVNFDLTAEWYFAPESAISVGLFYKDIDNPIFTTTTALTGTFTYAGVAVTNPAVTQPVNGAQSQLYGLEAAFQAPLTFLPAPFDGFGVNLSYSLVSGETIVPGRATAAPLPFQSERVASAQVYYENYGFHARVAYSYRSEFAEILGSSAASDVYTADFGSWDARLAYQFPFGVQLFVDGANLTNEPDYRYAGDFSQTVEAEQFGRVVRVGFEWRH
ncbi:MAG: TonB-dependent receptor [Hyphomonadaceae bacterium]